MAKFALLYFSDETEHEATPENERVYADIFRWFETNGPMFVHGGAELQPTRTATTIRKRGGAVTVTDGPFVETKESVGGLSIIQAPDMAAAVDFAKTWPGYGVEVRQIVEER